MFIKTITINGFKSYRELNSMSSLSPKHNAIIGSNGCGKSNILNAIQFVLSDEFNGLNASQRQQLISESHSGGTDPKTRLLMAFVEIIVDNTDRRMPLDLNEISFRRQIGLKKDQYFMNNKIITHSDIVNLLETAGFSRSNPYYIVKQGKVNEMATASDEYRLQVMREVAGTRIYDQRKSEAMKLLAESKQRSEQIDDCLKSLDEKMNSLQNESKDLEKFLKWDKRRRLLEYIIVNKEAEKCRNERSKLESKQEEENEVLESKRLKLQEIEEKSRVCDKRLKTICNLLEEYRKDMKQINKSIDELNEQKAKIESKINDFKEKLDFNKENELKVNKELKEVKQLIELKKKKLIFVNAKYEDLRRRESDLICDLSSKKSRKLELYSKQKRKENFGTIEERNRWIESQLPDLKKQIETNVKRIADLKAEEYDIINQKTQLETEQNEFHSEEEKLIESLQIERKELFETKKRNKQLESKRTELWDFENELKQKEMKLNETKVKVESRLTSLSGTSATVGRESVRKVLEIFEQKASNSSEDERQLRPIIDGYLGQVIDCFTFDANLCRAIEVTAKSKLFYHIVESDRIGTKIIAEVNRNRMFGEITFIAINKLNLKPIKYPDFGNNARPLTSLIKFDKKYEKVMKFLFDRTLICRNLEMASILSRSAKLDCVTVDGDLVSHKGLMSGGYYGTDTRMESFLNWKNTIVEIETIRQKLIETSKSKEENEKELIENSNSMSNFDIKHNKTKRKVDNLKAHKDRIRQELVDLSRKHESVGRSIASLESTLPSMRANRDSFENELELSLDSQLNESEQKELADIVRDIEKLSEEHSELCKRRNKLGTEKACLESDLDKNLEQRKNELEFALIDFKIYENESLIENESFDCELIDKKIDLLRKQLLERNTRIDELIGQQNEEKDLLETLKSAEEKQMDIINGEVKRSRRIGIKLSNIEKKADQCSKKLRNLGTIPSDCDKKYQKMSLTNEYIELEKCNRKLSLLTNVNQKSLQQLSEGQQKRDVLNAEKRNIDLGYESIEKLIETLEHQKYEAISITYRQVSKFFEEIFKKLVPEGKAFIDMIYAEGSSATTSQTSHSQDSQSSGGISNRDFQTPAYNRIDNFVGVKIRVAFTGTAVIKELNQLSGGQKTIVALSFIFAIQKCDPMPFYLFDEVDQALDPLYRKALADIMTEMCKTSQFISTTFRPELLESADKFFGVKSRNRISHIEEISKELAKDFIESTDDTMNQSSRRRRSVRFDTSADRTSV